MHIDIYNACKMVVCVRACVCHVACVTCISIKQCRCVFISFSDFILLLEFVLCNISILKLLVSLFLRPKVVKMSEVKNQS